MGYIDKTVSKNETLIKQAKICKLSFFDRVFASILYILGGIFVAVDMFVLKLEPIQVNQYTIAMSAVALAAVGGVLIAFMLLCAIYRLIQAIFGVDGDVCIPGGVFGRLVIFGLLAIAIGLIGYFVGEGVCDILCLVAGIVLGLIFLLFSILRYKSIKLVVTDRRICGRKNIWMTQSFDLPIDKIDNVRVSFSFWGKMFNYATITIMSVQGEYKLKYVKAPEEFKNLVIDFTGNDQI